MITIIIHNPYYDLDLSVKNFAQGIILENLFSKTGIGRTYLLHYQWMPTVMMYTNINIKNKALKLF